MNKDEHQSQLAARFGLALVTLAAAIALRGLMSPLLGTSVPFLTLFPAVVVASWYGGLSFGLLVTGIGGLLGQFFFIEPTFTLRIATTGDAVALVFFLLVGSGISVLNQKRLTALETASDRVVQLERRLADLEQAATREAETRRWALDTLASIGDAVICTDIDGRVTYMNAVAVELTGWSLEDARGKELEEIFVIINEESRRPAANPIKRILQEGIVLGLANHTVLISRTGAEVPIDDSGAPIRDEQRKIVGGVLVFRDIGERKAVEDQLRKTAGRLARSNEDLASFAHAISHDLQEPLRGMSTFSALLNRKYAEQLDTEAREYLSFITNGAARMSQMIRDLLAFSQAVNASSGAMSQVRLTDAINWAERNLEDRIRETHTSIHCEELPTVIADHVQLVQLFQNLIGNAIKYRSEHAPVIRISATALENHWKVSVTDNGIGIEEADRERIFQLFKRGNTDQPGSGIGLAICKRIVERHGGQIWVESQLAEGSTFHFTLSKQPEPDLYIPRGPRDGD